MDLIRATFDLFYDGIKPFVFRLTKDDPQRAHELFAFFCGFLHESYLGGLVLDNESNELHPPFELSNAAGFNKNGDFPIYIPIFEAVRRVHEAGFKNLGVMLPLVTDVGQVRKAKKIFKKETGLIPLKDIEFGIMIETPASVQIIEELCKEGISFVSFGTNDSWEGNSRPSVRRYPGTESLVNWMGLPGEGAEAVAQNLVRYGDHGVPITINFMSTPGKQGDELLEDLEGTVLMTRDLPYVDRFELNISCPNTHAGGGSLDARDENLRMLDAMLTLVGCEVHLDQEIYLKVSPDSTESDVDDTLAVIGDHRVSGIVTTNTSTNHDRRFIPVSPLIDGSQVGGASGNAVYDDSLRTQGLYSVRRGYKDLRLIACGGINSLGKIAERIEYGASGIQIYTPLVFSGPRLLRQIRMGSW